MRTRWLVAVGSGLIGLVWIAQGLGILTGRSFMVGDPRWALAGLVLVGIGLAVALSAGRGRRPS